MSSTLSPAPARVSASTTSDHPFVRALAGLAIFGSGLVHFAVSSSQGPLVLAVLVVVATAQLAFAVGLLSGRMPIRARAVIIASVPIVVWALLTLTSSALGSGLPLGPMLTAASLELFAALALAASVRFSPSKQVTARPWMFIVALVVGATTLPLVAVPAISHAQYPPGQSSPSPATGHHH
ncbi:hypothetical protein [Paramicrobacterium fandaimingii]|uniref:hypothetical protein n=1 Tax=Paramicrobacterium fandaimingii TaxID=2708079 RepID=UPI001420BEDE|nr:hypothetical protein [Microbacterium fandaimingii]